jgi:hypothetical protein
VSVDQWVGTATIHDAAETLGEAPRHVAVRVVAKVLQGVSGLPLAPDLSPILRLLEQLSRLPQGKNGM